MLETVEALQVASLIPVALVLYRLTRESSLSPLIASIGIVVMMVGVAIDIGFVTERLTYSKGPIGGTGFYIVELVVIGWLLCANAVAWRRRSLPRGLAVLGMATAATATLLYPLWAVRLIGVLTTSEIHGPVAPTTR
jgi:hypothetical protein